MSLIAFLAGFMLGAGLACTAIAWALRKLAKSASARKPFASALPIEQRPIFLSPQVGSA
jgi:hypothetical protein